MELPLELRLDIAKYCLRSYSVMIRIDKELYEFIKSRPKLLSFLKQKFTVKRECLKTSPTGDFIPFTIYYLNAKKHREDGPAVISKDGKIQEWWNCGKRHRNPAEGPAVVILSANNEEETEYWVYGRRFFKELPPLEAWPLASSGFHLGDLEWWVNEDPKISVICPLRAPADVSRDSILDRIIKNNQWPGSFDVLYKYGSTEIRIWYTEGKVHNTGGCPSLICIENNRLKYGVYYSNGICEKKVIFE